MTDAADIGALYRTTREQLTEFVLGLDDGQRTQPLPATPDWSARDVLAHVTGIVADVLGGNLAGVGSDAWTGAQLAARAGRSADDIAQEWSQSAPQIEAMAATAPPAMATALLADLATHDFDVRGAFGNREHRDSEVVRLVFGVYTEALGDRLDAAGVGALLIHTIEGDQVQAGHGSVGARVRGSRFDLVRALTGRRSADQIRSFIWYGPSEPFIAHFSQYPMRDEPLLENGHDAGTP